MQLTDIEITEFQRLYREEFGEDISRAKALEEGLRLVRLTKVILKPDAHAEPKS